MPLLAFWLDYKKRKSGKSRALASLSHVSVRARTVGHDNSLVRSRDGADMDGVNTDTVMHTGPIDPYIVGAEPTG